MSAWPISLDLATALVQRQRLRATRVDVLRDGQPVITGLRATDGSVTVSSATGSARRTCSLTAVDDDGDLVIDDPTDPLAPYGNELALYRGVTSLPGELVPLGVFRIDSAEASWSGGGVQIAVNGTDRSAVVAADKFTDYDSIYNGAPALYALNQLVQPALPASQVYDFANVNTMVTAQTYAPGDDRWAAAQELAAEIGCLLYFDQAGTLKLEQIVDPATRNPDWTFTVGQASLMTAVSNNYDRTAAANVIVAIAQGSNVDSPLLAVAQDDDPNSPTWVGGRFGSNVLALTSNTLNTAYDLQVYADSQLLLYKGATRQVQLSAVPVPHLDAYSIIAVQADRVGLADRFVVDQMTVPLGSGVMSITTRGVVV